MYYLISYKSITSYENFSLCESNYLAVGGMQDVVKQLPEKLVKLGHEVYVLTRVHPDRKFSEFNGVKIMTFNIVANPRRVENENDLLGC
jgi:glycogen synthase